MSETPLQLAALCACTTVALLSIGRLSLRAVGPSAAARSSLKAKLAKESKKELTLVSPSPAGGGTASPGGIGSLGVLDVRRKLQVAKGGATDHAGEVVVVALPGFDINKTIFGSVEGFLPRTVIKSKIGVELFWNDSAVNRSNSAYALVPKPPPYNASIMQFMTEECDLKMEHADGSFMDHLKFCHDYSAQHYKGQSPIPLFLHSIMGVGTNFFPMEAKKIPALKKLVTPQEFVQIQAFPTVLRLLTGTQLLDDLALNAHRFSRLHSLKMHRVIDNESIVLTRDELVVNLNYHLMHLLDFLPSSAWLSHLDDGLFLTFVRLHAFMTESKTLHACVDFDLESGEKDAGGGGPVNAGSVIKGLLPLKFKLELNKSAIKTFSKNINHDLHYELVWNN